MPEARRRLQEMREQLVMRVRAAIGETPTDIAQSILGRVVQVDVLLQLARELLQETPELQEVRQQLLLELCTIDDAAEDVAITSLKRAR